MLQHRATQLNLFQTIPGHKIYRCQKIIASHSFVSCNVYSCSWFFVYLLQLFLFTAINQCASNPCLNGASCSNEANGFVCKCKPGFYGDLCETEKDECASSPCFGDAACVDMVGAWVYHWDPKDLHSWSSGYPLQSCYQIIHELNSSRTFNNH